MNDFFKTRMGMTFFEGTMPSLVHELKRLNDNLEADRKERNDVIGGQRQQGAEPSESAKALGDAPPKKRAMLARISTRADGQVLWHFDNCVIERRYVLESFARYKRVTKTALELRVDAVTLERFLDDYDNITKHGEEVTKLREIYM